MRYFTRARAIAAALLGALATAATPGQALAQNAVLTGRVTSDAGRAIEGANVFITEMGISVGTNAEGNFTITIAPARVEGQQVNLRVRAVGFQPQTRQVRITEGAQTFTFQLGQDIMRMDEIIVTGVVEGTERAKVPFSVGRLSTEDIPVPAIDPIRALSGKVAGMRIAQTSGRPGTTPEIMLRGPTSINAANRSQGPLIIVDNVIMNVGSLEELGGLDIESVEVVKGAAGASLYGTRAANGVITIRTKRGSSQDGVRFNVRSEYGFSDMNSLDYGMPVNHSLQLDETGTRLCVAGAGVTAPCSRTIDLMTEILRINSVNADTVRTPVNVQWSSPSVGDGSLQNVFQSNIWPGQYYNTFAQMAARNPITMNAVDATGRIGAVRFYTSGSYTDEQGALKNIRGITSRRARVNLDYDARQDLLVSVSTMFDRTTRDLDALNFGALTRGALPGVNYSVRDSLGRRLIRGGGPGFRPTANGGGGLFLNDSDPNQPGGKQYENMREAQRYLGSVTTTYFPLEWVTLEGSFAYDNRQREDREHYRRGYRTQGISTAFNNGQMTLNNRGDVAFNSSLMATFRAQLLDDLAGKFTVRSAYDETAIRINTGTGQVFLVNDVHTLTNTSENKNATSTSNLTKNAGLSAGLSLDYRDRYIMDATFRRDGSSRFGDGNRWANFGRVSGVWRVSEEGFWNLDVVRDFRLRASRGTAGTTPNFAAQYETYTVTSAGIGLGQAGNSQLRPETTTEYEFGTDFTLADRFGVEITRALGTTRDQILEVGTPATLGFSTQWQNAGTLENDTWELGVNVPIINRRDLQWSMRGTWDRTRTYITELFVPEFVYNGGTAQGSGGFFRITDSVEYRDARGISLTNGHKANRYGNIWGRKFYKSCADLPSREVNGTMVDLRAQCGEGKAFQVNNDGWVVWVGEGNSWRDGITKNLWQTTLPAGQSPWAYPLYWGHPIIDRPLAGEAGQGIGVAQIIGNVFPDFRLAWNNNLQYKRLNVFMLFDGTFGHNVYNQAEAWGLLDMSSGTFDQAGKTVETAKPTGYHWRAGGPESSSGSGGFYDLLGVNSYNLEDASFVKMRELSATYNVGPVRGIGDWTVGVVGRNLLTFTKYTGYDPEVGATAGGNATGSGLINQVDAFDFPTLRNVTFTISTRF